MRVARFLLPVLIALAAAACARQQQSYYVIDPATGQPVPVVQQYSAPQYAQAGYQNYRPGYQPGYSQPAYAEANSRGLFNAQPQYGEPQYAANDGRGLFNAQPAYVQQQYPQQPYQSYVLQYHPPAAAAGG